MNEGRGERYRVIPADEEHLAASVTSQAGEIFEGTITEISIEGVGLRFPQERAPTLPLGESIRVTFVAPQLPESLEIRGAPSSRAETPAARGYRIEFEDPKAVEKHLPSPLFRLFNRRAVYRVCPGPDEPVEVTITPIDGSASSATARLDDISAGGVGVCAEPGLESSFAGVEEVQLSFCLPPRSVPIKVAARIRSRRLTDGAICYGVEFDASHSERFPAEEEEILDYVMRRQREELQRRVHVASES